jgi:predicted metal-dependent hydrolase
MNADRDRDEQGRARQARPRDELGRPLPYGSQGVEPVPEDPLPPDETLRVARDLVERGRPFSAHEVLEARWKAGPTEQRDLWQGLAQICVGLTHALRGNEVGAARLVNRGCARLEDYAATDGPRYGLDLTAVAHCAQARLRESSPGSR